MTYISILNWIIKREFETLDELISYHWYDLISNNRFRIIDSYDHQLIDFDKVIELVNKRRNENIKRNYMRYYGPYEFRQGPVPKIRKGHRWRGVYRHPATTQELRELSFAEVDEDIIEFKVKIRKKNLRTYWDDIPRRDLSHRSWKRNRKTQWKEI